MRGMKFTQWGIVWVLVLVSGIASAANLEDLLSLHGEEYISARDVLLAKGVEIKAVDTDNQRIVLLAEIMGEWQKHPELFKRLPASIERGYKLYEQTRIIGRIEPRMCILDEVKNFMCQGIEEKEYRKRIGGTFGKPQYESIIQTDDEVAQAKELNRAARLAVIEYLWTISDNWRVDYEITDAFRKWSFNRKNAHEIIHYPEIAKSFLPVFEDVFKRSTQFLVLENCAKIFINAEYKPVLSLLREKLDQCFKEEHYLSCLVLLPALEKFGDKKDAEKADEFRKTILSLIQQQKSEADMMVYETERRIEAQEKTKFSQEPGLPAEEKPKN